MSTNIHAPETNTWFCQTELGWDHFFSLVFMIYPGKKILVYVFPGNVPQHVFNCSLLTFPVAVPHFFDYRFGGGGLLWRTSSWWELLQEGLEHHSKLNQCERHWFEDFGT